MSRWLQQCGKKRRYRTEKYARQMANACEKRRKVKLRVYACAMCNGWHITSKPEKARE